MRETTLQAPRLEKKEGGKVVQVLKQRLPCSAWRDCAEGAISLHPPHAGAG